MALLPIKKEAWTELMGWINPRTLLIGNGFGGGRGGFVLAWNWVREERGW